MTSAEACLAQRGSQAPAAGTGPARVCGEASPPPPCAFLTPRPAKHSSHLHPLPLISSSSLFFTLHLLIT